MRANKVLLVLLVIVVSAISATSAHANSRGYVRPSGDGPNSCTPAENCVANTGSGSVTVNTDIFGVLGSQTFQYDVLNFLSFDEINAGQTTPNAIDALSLTSLNLQAGDLLTFVFAGSVPTAADVLGQSLFAVLGCGTGQNGIYDSSFPANLVSSKCTNYDGSTLIASETDSPSTCTSSCFATFTIASGITFPSQFAFSFPDGELPTGIDVAAGTTPAPEPASLSLLAAGLVGLGVFRRKRAA